MNAAWFVSPHGFGHAARSSAVMDAWLRLAPDTRFEIFSQVPVQIFDTMLSAPFGYHRVLTDIGLRQRSALEIDLRASLRDLQDFVPFARSTIDSLVRRVKALHCSCVVCDISPLGISVARAAGLPCALVENFTWDWIYAPYAETEPGFQSIIDAYSVIYQRGDLHIQVAPTCTRLSRAVQVESPVCRPVRRTREATRTQLGLDVKVPLVAITLGGMNQTLGFLDRLASIPDVHFLVTGMDRTRRAGNVSLLTNTTPVYMPDVLAAADLVVSKLGYSVLAETWQTDCPLFYVPRPEFRESEYLEAFAIRTLHARAISETLFLEGDWLPDLDIHLGAPRPARDLTRRSGAGTVAHVLREWAP